MSDGGEVVALHPPSGDYDATRAFLLLHRPDGPWDLCAIHPDKPEDDLTKVLAARFHPDAEEELTSWLRAREAERYGVYFHLNPNTRPGRKARKQDVSSVEWFHVDVDVRADNDADRERQQAQVLHLMQNPPESVPPPTVVIFSGGGYQAFWQLDAPLEVAGSEERAAEVERYTRRLEKLYGADPCHDVNRVMRLVGTVNFPNAKKRRLGRGPTLAQLVEWHEERVYAVDSFTQAPPLPTAIAVGAAQGEAGRVAFTDGATVKVVGMEDLQRKLKSPLPEWAQILVQTGHHPDRAHESRSQPLFLACCELVRCGASPDTILAVITDARFGISASVLDKGGMIQRYARRQVQRAFWQADDPTLRELNDEYTVITGGRTRIVRQTWDYGLKRHRLESQGASDFRMAWLNRPVQVGVDGRGNAKYRDAGSWWLEHPKRAQAEQITMLPDALEDVAGVYNLWRGWPVEPRPGDWSLMRRHILEVVADGDARVADYVLKWTAWAVQHPAEQAEVALVMQGEKGTGKGFYGRALCDLFGGHGLHVSSMEHVAGRFNWHLADTCLLFCDEAWWAGATSSEGQLKRLITEPTIFVEEKHFSAISVRNCLKLVMASNEGWVVPASGMERRFAVVRVSSCKVGDRSWFRDLKRQLDDGGLAAMLHDLLAMDLGDWHPREDVPRTDALAQQKERTLKGLDAWWDDLLAGGELPEWDSRLKDRIAVTAKNLLFGAVKHAKDHRGRPPTATALGRYLRERGCKRWPDNTLRAWLFPNLEEARKAWSELVGNAPTWGEGEEWAFAAGGGWDDYS